MSGGKSYSVLPLLSTRIRPNGDLATVTVDPTGATAVFEAANAAVTETVAAEMDATTRPTMMNREVRLFMRTSNRLCLSSRNDPGRQLRFARVLALARTPARDGLSADSDEAEETLGLPGRPGEEVEIVGRARCS